VPRLGGLALFGGLLVAMLVEVTGEHFFGWQGFFDENSAHTINYLGVMLGLTCMMAVGLVDDVSSLSPKIKFAGQVVAALIIALSGVLLSRINNPMGSGFIEFGWFAYPLTILYLVAFANIINLIDGLDGLASGIVTIVACGLLFVALSKGRMEATMFSVILIGVCLAFLRCNHYPASLYMGDSGALTLGTLLGVISLIGVIRSPTLIALIVPIVFAGFPVLDTLFAIIRRIRRKQPAYLFDTEHLHHVLLRNGFPHQQAVRIICAWTAVLTGGGMLISSTHGVMVYVFFILLALISLFLVWRLGLYVAVLRHYYNPRAKSPDAPSASAMSAEDAQTGGDAENGGDVRRGAPAENSGDSGLNPR
jgi:UDP-GlcNAc:undecaprenyl-phosphate GlcNAc-1-phosphate transferase